jgi:type II secretory pathway component PulF
VKAAALIIAALGVLWALVATFAIGPTFGKMFSDFAPELPVLTQLGLSPWGPLALAFGVFGGVGTSCAGRSKGLPLVLAIVGLVLQPAIFIVAMYLPVFAIAGAVK